MAVDVDQIAVQQALAKEFKPPAVRQNQWVLFGWGRNPSEWVPAMVTENHGIVCDLLVYLPEVLDFKPRDTVRHYEDPLLDANPLLIEDARGVWKLDPLDPVPALQKKIGELGERLEAVEAAVFNAKRSGSK